MVIVNFDSDVIKKYDDMLSHSKEKSLINMH